MNHSSFPDLIPSRGLTAVCGNAFLREDVALSMAESVVTRRPLMNRFAPAGPDEVLVVAPAWTHSDLRRRFLSRGLTAAEVGRIACRPKLSVPAWRGGWMADVPDADTNKWELIVVLDEGPAAAPRYLRMAADVWNATLIAPLWQTPPDVPSNSILVERAAGGIYLDVRHADKAA
jgi:hypothetical protein